MTKKNTILGLSLCMLALLFACSKSESDDIQPNGTIQYEKLFNNTKPMVLTTNAYISGEARTVGDGMPMKFYFSYDKTRPAELALEFKKFHYGTMPLKVNFRATVKLLSAKDKDGEKRVRLYCDDANTAIEPGQTEPGEKGSAKVDGYFYPESEKIEAFINFNMMNVTAYSAKQKIDLTRIDRYDEEMKAYNKLHKEQNN